MKKILLILLLLILMSVNQRCVLATDQTIDQGYTSYLTALDTYRLSHQDYETAKAAYLQYKTPTSQQDFLERGKKVLTDRDDVLINYLNFLLLRLVISPGVNFSDQTVFQSKIKVQIQYYINHKDSINAIFNLDDLTKKSQEAEKQYQTTLAVVNYVIGIILIGKTDYAFSQVEQFTSLLGAYTTLNSVSDKSSGLITRWTLEARNNQLLSRNKVNEARTKFDKLGSSYSVDVDSIFNDGKMSILQSFQYLKTQYTFLKQILETQINE